MWNECSLMQLPRGINGQWTSDPLGYDGNDINPLTLGDNCTFFGCYEYTTRWVENFRLMRRITVVNFNITSCIIGKSLPL